MISTKFAVSLHILTILARGPTTSAIVAREIATHPVLIRRLLRPLAVGGWIATSKGGPGGISLRQDRKGTRRTRREGARP